MSKVGCSRATRADISEDADFPWCGLLIDTKTLEIRFNTGSSEKGKPSSWRFSHLIRLLTQRE